MKSQTVPEVLIVGAGPTGLTLAIILRMFGISVRIIDKAEKPATVSKALAVWSGSLEALQALGVVEEFLASGRRMKGLTIGDGRYRLAHIEIGDKIDSPYPYPLLLPQSETERLLAKRLVGLGVTVERGVELATLSQDDLSVTAKLRHPDGREDVLKTAYLIGCDGARSAVRHALGVSFDGYTEPQTFLLGDMRIDGAELDHDNIYIWWHGGGTVALFPFEDNIWRMFAMRDGEGDDPPDLAELQSHAENHGPPGMRLRDPVWLSAFRVNERLAARFRDRRCFLAGDAAHIHSPAGGQGMNTGIQDAVNLGWKLAYVLRGVGDADLLLNSYEPERRAIAEKVVAEASQRLHLAFQNTIAMRVLKDLAVSVLGNLAPVQKILQTQLSETEIVYRDGPLIQLGNPPRKARRADVGGRARDAILTDPRGKTTPLWPHLSHLRHTLLLFGGVPDRFRDIAKGVEDRLAIVEIAGDLQRRDGGWARYGLDKAGWVLVRPDQVVAARGNLDETDSLVSYLDRVARTREV